MKQRLIIPGLVGLLSVPASADVSEAEFEQLRAELLALSQRVQTLEVENDHLRGLVTEEALGSAPLVTSRGAEQRSAEPRSAGPSDSWTDRIAISGDFRYRYEEIDVENVARRDRNRIRARAEITARLPYHLEVGTGIATGGDNPLSANQTLGGGATRKELGLNLAYVRWQPVEGAFLTAGKMKNPFFRPSGTGLLWDSDLNPEGIGAGWSGDRWFVNAAANFLESDGARSNQQVTWGAQGGVKLALGPATLTTGAGYFDIPVAGEESFFGGADVFFGNSFSCDDLEAREGCTYLHDYEELEWFATLDLDTFGMPLNIYADVVQNLAVDEFDQGWLVGARLGKARERGSWQLGYQYEELEADAAFGLATDSNFAAGGTDGKGHKLYGSYALERGINLSLTWFINNEFGGDRLDRPLDYDRIILDASFKY